MEEHSAIDMLAAPLLMLGAALFMLIAGQFVGFPPGIAPVTEMQPQVVEEV